ncbi:glycosyltransferase family 2 protein [Cyanobium sp. NIES-981]|uniref:glycosyltransferase family 2 protein n=1 Tax=Cyanobium sp. NIES-981 TaxID=1851505 RepID=UPI0012F9DF55|nr:glycosyltransferase family 2 protein [Cyanobium sp. NIES-981]
MRQVIDAIRPVAPCRLFVACDGPNPERPGEAEKVAATRTVIEEEIDWPCEMQQLYSDSNQGCRLGVSRAITWFFEQVEEGIILEDDCVPHPDFFPYCTELLERYRHDTRVWCISGNNFQNGRWRGDGSYYFSRYNHCWGWATWRHCWSHYDRELLHWPSLKASGLLGSIFENSREAKYWTRIWDRLLHEGKPDTWDYQWTLTCLMNGGITALPNRNLVTNIGFAMDACHTTTAPSSAMPLSNFVNATSPSGLFPLRHPGFTLQDKSADAYTYKHHFSISLALRLGQRLQLGKPRRSARTRLESND